MPVRKITQNAQARQKIAFMIFVAWHDCLYDKRNISNFMSFSALFGSTMKELIAKSDSKSKICQSLLHRLSVLVACYRISSLYLL